MGHVMVFRPTETLQNLILYSFGNRAKLVRLPIKYDELTYVSGREGQTCSEAAEGTQLPDIDVIVIRPDTKDGDQSEEGNEVDEDATGTPGREGQTCSEAAEGTQLPDIDVIVIRPDTKDGDQSEEGNEVDEDATGTPGTIDGYTIDGAIQDPDDYVTFTFTAPADDSYTIVIKYYYPSNGVDEIANVRFDLSADKRPGYATCDAQQIQEFFAQLTMSERGVHFIEDTCLDDGVIVLLETPSSNDPPLLSRSAEVIAAIDEIFPAHDAESQEALDACIIAIYTYSLPELELQFPECLGVGVRIVGFYFSPVFVITRSTTLTFR
eukprot:sb/3466798/